MWCHCCGQVVTKENSIQESKALEYCIVDWRLPFSNPHASVDSFRQTEVAGDTWRNYLSGEYHEPVSENRKNIIARARKSPKKIRIGRYDDTLEYVNRRAVFYLSRDSCPAIQWHLENQLRSRSTRDGNFSSSCAVFVSIYVEIPSR